MSTHHEGVGCDACQNNNFKGKRFKCLICFDYDLCSDCYDKKAVSGQHLNTHPMQCLLTSSDISIYYSGESIGKQCCSYTCPLCGLKGFNEETMSSHVNENHAEDCTQVICPICVSVPGMEPNQIVEFFANHMNSNIHQNCDDNNAVRIRQRIRGTSNNRSRRPQFSSSVTNAAGSGNGSNGVGSSGSGNGAGSSNTRENQLGSVAQLLTQFSDSRFVRSYAPGQQTVTSTTSSRQQGSSNCDRFMIPKWGQMRMDDVLWEGKKNESLTSRALNKKDDTPWLRNPPSNLIDEPGEEVSIFEMDRSVFVIQLLLSTLSIEVPLHGTDPVPQQQLFDDSESEVVNEQTNKNETTKKSQNITGNTDKSNHSSTTKMNRRNVLINDGINRNSGDNTVEDDDDDDDDDDDYGKNNESGQELSDKDETDDNDNGNNDSRTIQKGNCDGLKRRTHRNNTKNNNTKPYLRLNSAPPTSGSGGGVGGGNVGTPNNQKTGLSAHNTTKPLLPTSSGNVNSLSQARASKVRSASSNSGTSLSSLTTTMRSTLGPMNQTGAMNVVSPTGRRRNFTTNQNNISSVGGGGGGAGGGNGANGGNAQQRQQQHPESSSN